LQLQGFDSSFQNGFEDVDFCLRAGVLGREVHYCAESVVEHLESVSPGRFLHERQNVEVYRRRWMPRITPDDLDYYIKDDLLRICYEGRYPFRLEFSPLLATIDHTARQQELEELVQTQAREAAEIQRENMRLKLELGAANETSPELQYQKLRLEIQKTVGQLLPEGSTILVVSKGDGALLNLPGCRAWHFPQNERGSYAGHHPADSVEAIVALESLRKKGATHLLIPATFFWWRSFYKHFIDYLESNHKALSSRGESCVIYSLVAVDRQSAEHKSSSVSIASALKSGTEAHLDYVEGT